MKLDTDTKININKKQVLFGIGLAILAVAFNILNARTTGAINWALMFLGIGVLSAIIRALDLSKNDLGLGRSNMVRGLKYGGIAVVAIGLGLGLTYLIHPTWFVDSRYDKSVADVLVMIFVRIPFHTVLIEELLFRGALLGFFMKFVSVRSAAIGSSVLFGLWHIVPSLGIAESSQTISTSLQASAYAQLLSVMGVVLVTTIAGLMLCWLRIKSKSLLAPMFAHWAVNAFALLFATLAVR